MSEQGKIRIADKPVTKTKAIRDVHAGTLMELTGQDGRIAILDADLMNFIGTVPLARIYPERSFNYGIREANMIRIAVGMPAMGLIPLTHTFDYLVSRRVAGQVLMSCAYAELSTKIIGSDPDITAAYNGGTRMALEDCAIMRSILGITIAEPVDNVILADVLRQTADTSGNFYIRPLRKQAVRIYEKDSVFFFGKVVAPWEGSDVSILTGGICVADALIVADTLASQGIRVEVVNPFTIKPMGTGGVTASVRKAGAVVIVENYNIIGGLGSAVSKVLTEHYPVPLGCLGVHNTFGEVGPVGYLRRRFQMMPRDIVEAVLRAVNRRQSV